MDEHYRSPHQKDAEAAGRWVVQALKPSKTRHEIDADTLAWVARWAGHWGRLAIEQRSIRLVADIVAHATAAAEPIHARHEDEAIDALLGEGGAA